MDNRNEDGARYQRTPPEVDCQKRADSTGIIQKRRPKILHPQSKRASVLREFLKRGDAGLNCFEAANQCHDYVLRSSISDYRRNLGIEFNRKFETVPGHGGSKIDCVRYSLSAEGARVAREVLGDDHAN